MKYPLIIAASALTIGIVIGLAIQDGSDLPVLEKKATAQSKGNNTVANNNDGTELPATVITNSDIKKLYQLMEEESLARKSLEKQLSELTREVAALAETSQSTDSRLSEEQSNSEDTSSASNSENNWFNEQILIDSGMSYSEASELKTFFEQQELDRMYLRNQSAREGWDRNRFREEMQILVDKGDSYLSQLDESTYDSYLYASGQPNRVRVTSVLGSSQAGTAGIQSGDHIVRYDNERIYSGFELRSATSGGEINESVAVEVERDGEILEFYLARGPLGIRMNSVSIQP